ncbi:MAG: hypothetical protein KatS3mg005_0220 [Bryobacteraceae bacterium]|nr:MAG: hypothetical protein KatS3mg005_0220 [Bryobacteraceae bacterium]
MPVAAVPRYLRAADFSKASPALRFGLLLSIWTERSDQERQVKEEAERKSEKAKSLREELGRNYENLPLVTDRLIQAGRIPALWTKNDHGSRQAWSRVCSLTREDKERMQALDRRMRALARPIPAAQLWICEAEAISPFTTGLGNEHPQENGFSFLNPYGLPYLPGSGVKGVVREAARQLSEGQWEDSRGWDKEPAGSFTVRVDGEEKEIGLTALDVLFGRETPEGESEHFRGVLSFWDVIPQIPGDQLRVEVMTPHQSHYYQQKKERKSGDSTSPHDSGQPNPILFLTVPPGAKFQFIVTCDVPRLKRIAPGLAEGDRWKKLLDGAFGHAFDWLGFGAKTAVGYGAMRRAGANRQETGSGQASSDGAASAPAKPAAASQTREEIWENATLTWRKGSKELVATAPNRPKAILRQQDAERFLDKLPASTRELLERKSLSPFRVRVRVEGNMATILDPA